MIRKALVLLLTVLCAQALRAEISLDIRIYSNASVQALEFYPLIGKYSVYENDKLIGEVLKTESVRVSIAGDSLLLQKGGKVVGTYRSLTLSGVGLINCFKVKPLNAAVKEREYDDDLRISVVNGAMLILNHVDLENYVAGVVQSEGGGSVKENEFYVVQAICCRTYALNNSKKHSKEGFHLCDETHCQFYAGRCANAEIRSAVFKTAGDVIVDKDKRMISAAFHANSGGETVNSEDVWKTPTSYLKSVTDTFSLKMPAAKWEKRMPTADWLKYLADRFKYPVDQEYKRDLVLNFTQEHRKIFLVDSIRLSDIRTDLGLRSTFFSVKQSGEEVVFSGKGYGHGVGLSQQGAIRMAQLGYNYRDIIRFYYSNVEIMSYELVLIRDF